MNAKDLAEARRLFQRAADLDPKFAQSVAAFGYTFFAQILYSSAESPLETLQEAL
jgi:hypothetical protein